MATVIDALYVTLGMDAKAFKKGADDAIKVDDKLSSQTKKNTEKRRQLDRKTAEQEKKQSQQYHKQTKENTEAVRKFRNQLLGIAALFTGGLGMARFLSSTITTAANVGRLANDIDESAASLIAWQRAAEATGGSASGMASAMTQAGKTISMLKVGIGDSSQILGMQQLAGAAGVAFNPRNMKKPSDVLLQESRILQGLTQRYGRASAFQQAQHTLGMDQGTFDLLKQGPKAVQAMVDAQRPYAEQMARLQHRAQQVQQRLSVLNGQFKAVGVTVVSALMPSINKLIDVLGKFGQWVDAHKTQINQWITNAATDAEKFAHAADHVAQALGGWKTILEGLLALKVASFISKIAGLTAAFRGLSAFSFLFRFLSPVAKLGFAYEGGKYVGGKINKHLEGTEAGHGIGHFMAFIMAGLGDKQANEALGTHMGGATDAGWRQRHAAQFRSSMYAGMNGATSAPGISNNTHSEVHIDNINIQTPATDAEGLAQSIRPAISRHSYVPQSNPGVR